jgi:hypothetical protein
MKMNILNIVKVSLGGILLLPALLSVLAFIVQLVFEENMLIHFVDDRGLWTGTYGYDIDGGGGGYMSALPVYFGLMALAGVYLIGQIKEN